MIAIGNVPEQNDKTYQVSIEDAAVIIPTFNCGKHWKALSKALERQGIRKSQVLIVDSSSTDDTRMLVEASGYDLRSIPTATFRHGATRQLASNWISGAKYLIYLTQDSIPEGSQSIRRLLAAFNDPTVGAAYGRQVPRANAGPIERHARLFNYPSQSDLRTYDCRKELGIRAAFFSNSFAAYRRTALEAVGGFPTNTIVSEDVHVAALLLRAGWKTKYQATATTIHSHQLTLREEFSRYFDIGIHHSREKWLMEEFGKRQGEGLAFVKSELKYLSQVKKSLIPVAVVRNVNKYFAYHLGLNERRLNHGLKKTLSAQKAFWLDESYVACERDGQSSGESSRSSLLRKAV
jgi:rhamnosyltransferase